MLEINDDLLLEHAKLTANIFHNGICILKKLPDGSYKQVFINEYLVKDLGYTMEEVDDLTEKGEFDVIYISDKSRFLKRINETSIYGESTETIRLVTKDEKIVWYIAHFYEVILKGEPCIAIAHTNIQELIGTQMKLESDNNKWLDIIDSIPLGICIFNIKDNQNNTIAINKHMVNLANELGRELDGNHRNWSMEELVMIFNQNVFAFCMSEDRPKAEEMLLQSEKESKGECIFRLRGSTQEHPVYVYSSCVSKKAIQGGTTYYVTFQDVTLEELQRQELKANQEILYSLSYYDSLTGVKNRNAFSAFSDNCRNERIYNVGIAFCDLNGLKRTNDTLGHMYGDKMLVEFADILKKYFPVDNIYRISGDEFVIAIPEVDKYDFTSIMAELVVSVEQAGKIASIGYMWKESVSDMRRRSAQAEQIMYVEKQKYYEETRKVTSKHRPLLLNSLLHSLEAGEFRMYLQPKAAFNNSKIFGAEALVRRFDKDGKIVPPYEFIPQLETERLIPKIDYFMLEEACKFLESLKKRGIEEFILSVNMSRVTLVENNYIETVSMICNRYDFNRNQLEFEITESNETMDNFRLEEYVKTIKSLGIGISIDDFGTEYSSLPMFILEGIDYVKLDRSLVIQSNKERASKVLEHTIRLSHDLGMKVIAEGIETKDELDALSKMNCDLYQGYYLSKPIPVKEFIDKFL